MPPMRSDATLVYCTVSAAVLTPNLLCFPSWPFALRGLQWPHEALYATHKSDGVFHVLPTLLRSAVTLEHVIEEIELKGPNIIKCMAINLSSSWLYDNVLKNVFSIMSDDAVGRHRGIMTQEVPQDQTYISLE